MIDAWYLENLCCPRDYSKLNFKNNTLCCNDGHSYPVVDGVPVMLLEEKEQTMGLIYNSIKRSKGELVDLRCPDLYLESLGISEEEKLLALSLMGKSKVDPVVSVIIAATSGLLYKSRIGKLDSYPIPTLRLERGEGKRLLDIGCNWGRWSVSAHQLGYQVVGVDPSLGAIMAARRVSHELHFDIKYVVVDGRFLPFRQDHFDVVFSYSVLQHLSKMNVELCLKEISRSLKKEGYSLIQMPNGFGIRSFYHQLKRRFKGATDFEVRYWKPYELVDKFNAFIGKTSVEVDGFLGLGIQKRDIALMPLRYKIVIKTSECLRAVSHFFPPLIKLADSLYLRSIKK